MCRKHLCLVWALLLLGAASSGQAAELAHRWSFNGDPTDSVGGQDAVIVDQGANDAVFGPTEITLAGGGKGASDYIDLADGIISGLGDTATVEIWATQISVQNWSRIFDFGASTSENIFMSWTTGTGLNTDRVEWLGDDDATLDSTNAPYTLGQEYHIVVVFEPGSVTWYTAPADSDDLGAAKGSFEITNLLSGLDDTNNWLGRSQWGDNTANASWNEVRLWVGALTEEEREQYHDQGPDTLNARAPKAPQPVDKATDVVRETSISWGAADGATSHDVYFGTELDAVATASRASSMDVLVSRGQSGTSYDPPVRLELGRTYYWRIDEVFGAGDIETGPVWTFTVEPYAYPIEGVNATASVEADAGSEIEKVVNGSGVMADGGHSVNASDMWKGQASPGDTVTVDFEFDRVYKVDGIRVWNYNHQYEAFLGFSSKDVTIEYSADGVDYAVLGDYALTQGTGRVMLQPQLIDFGGAPAKYVRFVITSNYNGLGYGLSEVQFYQIPTFAREPQPVPGAEDVDPGVVLSWRPGREAVTHEVHVGADANAVAAGDALAGSVSTPSYDTAGVNLLMGEKYYWMVNEVNEAEATTTWSSAVWDFNTPAYLAVDDFEDYDDEEGTRIYDAWIDGFGIPANGSVVGNIQPPYAEQTIVLPGGGDQGMPFSYGEEGATTSEAVLTFASAQDWTRAGASTLVLWFRGDLGNAPGQLYLKINNTQVNYSGSTASLAAPVWKQWNVDIASLGAAAKSVKTLTLGVTGSGDGTLYVDEIRLYRDASPATGAPSNPGEANLVAYYPMSDSAADASGNNRNGTAETGTSFTAGPAGYGRAIMMDGVSGHVTLPVGTLIQSLNSATFTAWVNFSAPAGNDWERIFDFGTGTTNYMFLSARQTASGPMTFGILATGGTEVRVVAPNQIPAGWHHVAVVIDSATMNIDLYEDGLLVDSNTTDMLPSSLGETTNNWLGRSPFAADEYYTGAIDEFRIYNRALTAGEVQYLAGDR